MHPTIHRPASEHLPPEPKHHHTQERNPRRDSAKHHHGRNITVTDGPVVDVVCLAEAECVLADGGDNHDLACDGLVTVDGVL